MIFIPKVSQKKLLIKVKIMHKTKTFNIDLENLSNIFA